MSLAPAGPTPLVSASQISKYRECARKWAWQYVAGFYQPQGEAAQLGDEVDAGQLQPYLTTGRAFDYTLPTRPGFLQSGYIAASALPHLPSPMAHGLECQKHFVMPSPTGIVNGKAKFGFQGYLDFWHPYFNGPVPLIGDFKTSKTLDYAKDGAGLRGDPQAMLYAMWALFSTGAHKVDLRWIYMRTKGSVKAQATEIRVDQEHVAEQFASLDETAVQIIEAKETCTNPLDLPPSADSCEAFGGCPYRDKCNLSPEERTKSLAAKWRKNIPQTKEVYVSTSALMARLAAKKTAPATPSVMGCDISQVPAPPADRIPAAFLPPPAPQPLPINPPESALPPAPPVGVAVAAPAEAPKKRGRPAKPPLVASVTLPEPTVDRGGSPESCPQPSEDEAGAPFEITWGEECFQPVQYNTFRVGPFKATGTVQTGETLPDAMRRVSSSLAAFAADERQTKADAFKSALARVSK